MEIDLQFLKQMMAEGGERRLQEECLKCFGDQNNKKSNDETFNELCRLQATTLHSFVSRQVQGLVSGAKEIVHSLRSGMAPVVDIKKCGEFLQLILAKM